MLVLTDCWHINCCVGPQLRVDLHDAVVKTPSASSDLSAMIGGPALKVGTEGEKSVMQMRSQ